MPISPAQGVRARARAALATEIKEAAKRQMAVSGAAGLSLRAVARELGMVSSALYRYYPSRDELLTALIIDAYDDVAREAGLAVQGASTGPPAFLPRWLAATMAIRSWARTHPHDYALVYGSPVPGYRAPAETIPAAARVASVPLGLLDEAVASGELTPAAGQSLPPAVGEDLARLRQTAAPEVPEEVLCRALGAWSQMFGLISLELFGHLHNVIYDYDAFFELHMTEAGRRILG